MAYKKGRRVSGSTTNTILIVAGVAALAFVAYNMMKPAATTTVIHTAAPGASSTAATVAEVTAGASALTSIANDLFGSDDGS